MRKTQLLRIVMQKREILVAISNYILVIYTIISDIILQQKIH